MNVVTAEGETLDVVVVKELCASSGACVFAAPGVFEFDDDDEAYVVGAPEALTAATLREVAYNCPAGAITVS